MAAQVLDGAAVARQIRSELAERVRSFEKNAGRRPCLRIVLVGDKADSEIYVRSKLKSASDEGIDASLTQLAAQSSIEKVLDLVRTLNADPTVDGILVQSPLPSSLGDGAMLRVFDTIDPAKDVDGFTPVNVGRLVQNRAALVPCTPAGIVQLLDRSRIEIAGRHAVVIGRSDIVGKPIAMLLLHRHATVTICHSRTPDLAATAARADILVSAIGRAGFVRKNFVKAGAVVIDVGINRVTDAAVASALLGEGSLRHESFLKKGSAVVGDVHPEVSAIAGALTPVPGGVGPLTIAMLMHNTLVAAEQRQRR
jgi:methylenetetrahydrofolate dehydrogenase (NADP+)/methenyltetrahydrofolate cyclohydrolase